MEITITGRKLKITPALYDYGEKKLERAALLHHKINRIHMVMSVEKFRHQAEIVLTGKGILVEARSTTGDMYASVDQAADKLLRQLRELKRKRSSHKRRAHSGRVPGA